MAYELVEQMQGEVPDVVLYPTGGGTGLVGMWKAFDEMQTLGWIAAGRRPRFVSVQAAGCAPVVKAFVEGRAHRRVARSADACLWLARAVADRRLPVRARVARDARHRDRDRPRRRCSAGDPRVSPRESGIDVCPEGGAAWAALAKLRESGFIGDADRVVVFNTGTGLKYR